MACRIGIQLGFLPPHPNSRPPAGYQSYRRPLPRFPVSLTVGLLAPEQFGLPSGSEWRSSGSAASAPRSPAKRLLDVWGRLDKSASSSGPSRPRLGTRGKGWNPSHVRLCSHAWPKNVFGNTGVGLDCDSIPVNPLGEKLLLLSYVNHFSRLPLARPRVRERHPCPSRAERRRFAAASPLAESCLASAVASLPAALVVLDPHVHALPSSCVRTPPFVGSRPIPAALIFGEPLPPLPCPITVRFGSYFTPLCIV
jgi:hypothetical protein